MQQGITESVCTFWPCLPCRTWLTWCDGTSAKTLISVKTDVSLFILAYCPRCINLTTNLHQIIAVIQRVEEQHLFRRAWTIFERIWMNDDIAPILKGVKPSGFIGAAVQYVAAAFLSVGQAVKLAYLFLKRYKVNSHACHDAVQFPCKRATLRTTHMCMRC